MGSIDPPAGDLKYAQFLKLLNPSGAQETVSFCLIGLGRIGSLHFANLLSNSRVKVTYVVEARAERREEVEKSMVDKRGIKFVGTEQIDTVLGDKTLQAVMITTPTFTHKQLVLKALDYGKAVFCEKPLAETYEDVKVCYAKAKEVGRPLLSAFNRRFDPSFSLLVHQVHSGVLGKIHIVKTVGRDSPMASIEYLRGSSGIFHDCAIHDIDLICYCLGQFPTRVFASGTAFRKEIGDFHDFDTVGLQMVFPGGTISFTDLSRFAVYGCDQRIEVFGPGGMLQCNNQSSLGIQSFKSDGVQDHPIYYNFISRYDESYKVLLDHFINVVLGKEKPLVTPQQVLAGCLIASAATKSAKTGLPVDIKYEDDF